jgi:hypothetical protein
VVTGRPAVLRIAIDYKNNLGQGRAGVPPDSVWVTMERFTGSVTLYDAAKASDSYTWKSSPTTPPTPTGTPAFRS